MVYIETISTFFAHPFVILLLGGLAGRLFFLPRLLKDKSVMYKIETIQKICDIKNLVKEIEFVYDRTFNTLRNYHTAGRPVPFSFLINGEVGRLSEILNEKWPLYKKYLDTEIEIYFKNDKLIQDSYSDYLNRLKELHNLISGMPDWPEEQIFTSKFSDLREVKEINLAETENKLISAIKKGVSIHSSFK